MSKIPSNVDNPSLKTKQLKIKAQVWLIETLFFFNWMRFSFKNRMIDDEKVSLFKLFLNKYEFTQNSSDAVLV